MFAFTKNKVGTKVVVLPQINSIKRVGRVKPLDQAFEAIITDVKRVNVTLAKVSGPTIGAFRINESSNLVTNDANYGYMVFEDWDAFNQFRSAQLVKERLIDAVRGYGEHKLSDAQLVEIGKILGWEELTSPLTHDEE